MSTMQVFWALVHNDTRWGSVKSKNNGKWNLLLIFTTVFVIGFGLYSSNIFAEKVILVLNFIATPNELSILLLAYGSSYFTYKLLPREWLNGTEGWWLSLPYSRKLLLAAKCMCGLLQFIKFILIVVMTIVALTFLAINLHPDAGNNALLQEVTQRILYSSTIAILICPFFLIGGITLAAWDHLELLREFLPASILGTIGNIFIIFATLNQVLPADSTHSPNWLSWLLVFGFSTGLSVLFFYYIAYVLEHFVGYSVGLEKKHLEGESRMTRTKIITLLIAVILGVMLLVKGYSGS